jgi:5-methylcytosine-specific restriction protein A
MSGRRTNTGKNLQRKWNIPARHVLYHKDGAWYEPLERFPGALCDPNGYVLFPTQRDYESCSYLNRGQKLNVVGKIPNIPGYVRMAQG